MLSAEWVATHSHLALVLDGALIGSFCLVGPAAWRVLAARPHATIHGRLVGHLAYVATCTAVVGALGYALPRFMGLTWTYIVEPSSLLVVLVLFAVGGWGLGRDIELELGIEEARTRAAQLSVEAEHAQLLALRSHLDPHFLFNTLNAIAEWCREDPAVAETATLELASLLRTMLGAIRRPMWALEEEISLLRRLFALYRIRDDRRYRLELDVPSEMPDVAVPAMVLLPLFENAITHGPGAGHEGSVSMRVVLRDGRIDVEMRNPGRFTGERVGGEGIGIARRRLTSAFGKEGRLTIRADGDTTHSEISFPALPLTEPARP